TTSITIDPTSRSPGKGTRSIMSTISYAEPRLQSSTRVEAEEQHPQPKGHHRFRVHDVLLYIALAGLAALFCLPFVWLILTSLKPPAEVFSATWLPSTWTWSNYSDVFHQAPIL